MSLGNYRVKPIFFNGIQVGEDIYTEDFPIGKYCEGMTADGETVCSIWLKGKRHDNPENISADITDLRHERKHMISVDGAATPEDWEMLLSDLLDHVRSLK